MTKPNIIDVEYIYIMAKPNVNDVEYIYYGYT